MTMLLFPEDGDQRSAAFSNALSRGEFVNEPGSKKFWALHELQASEIENDEVVADWFYHKIGLQYIRIPRTDEDTKL